MKIFINLLFVLFLLVISVLSYAQNFIIGEKYIFNEHMFFPYDNIKFNVLEKWTLINFENDTRFGENNKTYYFTNLKSDTIELSTAQINYDKNPKLCYDMNELSILIKQNGLLKAKKILQGIAWIGMSKKQAIASWGNPTNINTTITKYGKTEQWIYGEKYLSYLYFTNGKLSLIQD